MADNENHTPEKDSKGEESKSVRKGIAEVTEGEKWSWFGQGKIEMSCSRSVEIAYGVKTSIEAAVHNTMKLGLETSVFVGGEVSASFAQKLEYSKGKSTEVSREGEFDFQDSYAGTVGSDAATRARMTSLKVAIGVMVTLQAVTALGLIITMAAVQSQNDDEVTEVYTSSTGGFPVSGIASIVTLITGLTAAVGLFLARFSSLSKSGDPTVALTMDNDRGAFLGFKKPITSQTGGITIASNLLDLSVSSGNLGYNKPPGASSIVGFTNQAGTTGHDGSRISMSGTGDTGVFARTFSVKTVKTGGTGSDPAASIESKTLALQVTDDTGTAKDAKLSLDVENVLLQRDANNALTLSSSDAGLIGGSTATQSSVKLTASDATLASGGSTVVVSGTKVELAFGSTKFTLDPSGAKINSDLQIISPGGPTGIASAITSLKSDVAKINATYATTRTVRTNYFKLQGQQQKAMAALDKQLIAMRAKVNALTDTVGGGK